MDAMPIESLRTAYMSSDSEWMHQQFRVMVNKQTLCNRTQRPELLSASVSSSTRASSPSLKIDTDKWMKTQFSAMVAKWALETRANKASSSPSSMAPSPIEVYGESGTARIERQATEVSVANLPGSPRAPSPVPFKRLRGDDEHDAPERRPTRPRLAMA
jgi:hypothetical protein